jgi:hypothetical protein
VSDLLFFFGVLIRGNSWLAFDVAISTSSFGLLYNRVWHLQDSIMMVKDYKPAFLGWFLQLMFFQWVLDLVVSDK